MLNLRMCTTRLGTIVMRADDVSRLRDLAHGIRGRQPARDAGKLPDAAQILMIRCFVIIFLSRKTKSNSG